MRVLVNPSSSQAELRVQGARTPGKPSRSPVSLTRMPATDSVTTVSVRPQSRWWYVAATLSIGLVGVVSNRSLASSPDASVADIRSAVAALTAISILSIGAQMVLVGTCAAASPPRTVGHPPRWAVFTVAFGGGSTAGLLAFVLVSASFGFRAAVALAAALTVTLIVLSVPPRATLLGDEQWFRLGLIGVSAAIPTLVVSATAVLDDAPFALLAAIVVGEALGTAMAYAASSSLRRAGAWPQRMRRPMWIGLGGSTGLALFLVLMSTTSRQRLSTDAVGYSQSATVTRSVFFVLLSIAFIFFPVIAKAPLGTVRLRRAFHQAFGFTCAAALIAVVGVLSAPTFFVTLVTSDDTASPTTVRLLTIAYAATGIAVVPLMQFIAHGSRMALAVWMLVLPMGVGQLLASTATALALTAVVCAVTLLVAMTGPALLRVQPVLHPSLVEHPAVPPISATRTGTTVVIPSFNPGPVVRTTISDVLEAFDRASQPVNVIVVTDGSTDASPGLIDNVSGSRVVHLRHDRNCGKGAALRTGFAAARTPVVAFIDADGDLSPMQLAEMVRIQIESGADIVFGSKRHVQSSVDATARRKVTSWGYQLLIRGLFQLDIPDTQTGIKVFSRPLITTVLPVVHEDGFALDLELFVAARSAGYNNFVEVPVRLVRAGDSTISSRSVITMLGHTIRIFWRAKVTLKYLRSTAEQEHAAIRAD